MKAKKKSAAQTFGTLTALLIYVVIGALAGALMTGDPVFRGEGFAPVAGQFVLLLVFFYLGFIIQIALHEAGHLVFGLWTGYRFLSYRIFSLMWLRQDGRILFRRLSLAGTGGQCLLAPPDWSEDFPYVLYNLGGVLMNVITALLFWALAFLCPPALRLLLRLTAVAGLASALTNGLPLRVGPIDNDGRNILSIRRSPAARRAFWLQMKLGELQAAGKRLRDIPEDWFSVPGEEAADNSILAAVPFARAQRLMDAQRFDEAAALQDRLLAEGKLLGLYRGLLVCDRVCCELFGAKRADVLNNLLDREQEGFMRSMRSYPSVLRTRYVLALLRDGDREKAGKLRADFEKMAKSYPYPAEIESERELMALADEKA